MAMNYLGDFTTANTLYVYFNTFDSNDPSASVVVSAFVVGDILIYKDGSVSQRTSTSGFVLLDTDGIDFDGIVGVHGFQIDLSDNSDAGFYAAGNEYVIIVGPVTVDGATINFVAASFSIERTGGVLALLKGTNSLANIEDKIDIADTAIDVAVADLANATDGLGALKALIDGVPTTAEFDARTLVAASYFNPAADTVALVTTVTNQLTAAALADAVWDELLAGHVSADTTGLLLNEWQNGGRLDLILDIIAVDTTTDIPALIATAQADLDTITGAAGALLDSNATSTQLVDDMWDEVLTGATHNVASSAGRRLRQIEASFVITSGTAQAGTANTITLAAGESATNDIFAGDRVVIVAGTGIGEHGIITAYNGTTKVATMSQNWVITPDITSEYELAPADVDVETWQHAIATLSATTNLPEVDAKSISDDAAAADNLELDYDGTGFDKANSTIGTTTANTDMRGTDSAGTAANLALIDTVVDANKVIIDKFVFTSAGRVDANIEAVNDITDAAVKLAAHALETLPVTFTTAGGSTTAAVLNLVDGGAAEATDNDKYNGRILVFNNGTLDHEVAEITSYVAATKTATISAVTTAPTSAHTARMV